MPTDVGPVGTQRTSTLRDVVLTTQFKKDFKREDRGRHRATLRADLQAVVEKLAYDVPLPPRMVDHPLGGNWKDHPGLLHQAGLGFDLSKNSGARNQVTDDAGEAQTQSCPFGLPQ